MKQLQNYGGKLREAVQRKKKFDNWIYFWRPVHSQEYRIILYTVFSHIISFLDSNVKGIESDVNKKTI